MSLDQWHKNGWIKKHQTTAKEVSNLFAIVDRDLKDARNEDISEDWRFGIAYNAALKLCTILIYAEGYRPEKNLAHYRTLHSLPLILGGTSKSDASYLDSCRSKRNTVEYDAVGGATVDDVVELISFVQELREKALKWMKAKHPKLM
jgi:uncharacterized protein (UPF0332 family)